ncbi:MAG: L-ribulose-5-phosphate 4-epimerase [Sedimentisphaerales bacterium]
MLEIFAIMHEELKKAVCEANLELQKQQLVICSWGNVSGIDRSAGLVVIKPSGVSYDQLTPDKMVVLDLEGKIFEGTLNPSSDAPTHLELYRNFETIGGICHTHSPSATMWAQACKEIPCFGTTHADNFYGPIPVTEVMTEKEIKDDYELNTGKVIVRRIAGMDPMQMPAVLVANHGPFTWGADPAAAVEENVVLEQIATMALGTITINPDQGPISSALLDKHYLRKHGTNAYYGQES